MLPPFHIMCHNYSKSQQSTPKQHFSSEARPKAESGGRRLQAELGIRLPKKQKWSKKNSTTTTTTGTGPILYLSNYSLSYLGFWHFLSLQKLFIMFSTTPIYPTDILTIFFANKNFFYFPKPKIHDLNLEKLVPRKVCSRKNSPTELHWIFFSLKNKIKYIDTLE